jgi:hypothetical protein
MFTGIPAAKKFSRKNLLEKNSRGRTNTPLFESVPLVRDF